MLLDQQLKVNALLDNVSKVLMIPHRQDRPPDRRDTNKNDLLHDSGTNMNKPLITTFNHDPGPAIPVYVRTLIIEDCSPRYDQIMSK